MRLKLWLIPSAIFPVILIGICFLLGDAAYNSAVNYVVVEGLPKLLLFLVLLALLVLNIVFVIFAVRRVGMRRQLHCMRKVAIYAFALIGLGFFLAVNIMQPYFRARLRDRDDMGGCISIIRGDHTEAICESPTQ